MKFFKETHQNIRIYCLSNFEFLFSNNQKIHHQVFRFIEKCLYEGKISALDFLGYLVYAVRSLNQQLNRLKHHLFQQRFHQFLLIKIQDQKVILKKMSTLTIYLCLLQEVKHRDKVCPLRPLEIGTRRKNSTQ